MNDESPFYLAPAEFAEHSPVGDELDDRFRERALELAGYYSLLSVTAAINGCGNLAKAAEAASIHWASLEPQPPTGFDLL